LDKKTKKQLSYIFCGKLLGKQLVGRARQGWVSKGVVAVLKI
jgi:hypothetical protein